MDLREKREERGEKRGDFFGVGGGGFEERLLNFISLFESVPRGWRCTETRSGHTTKI